MRTPMHSQPSIEYVSCVPVSLCSSLCPLISHKLCCVMRHLLLAVSLVQPLPIQPLGLDLAECSDGVCISKVRKGCSAERQGVRCVFLSLPSVVTGG